METAQNTFSKNNESSGASANFNPGYGTYSEHNYCDKNCDQNGEQYDGLGTEYPIGDGQEINDYAGDYNTEHHELPNSRLNRNFVHLPTEKAKVFPKVSKVHQHQARVNGSQYPAHEPPLYPVRQRFNWYRSNGIGDHGDYVPLTTHRPCYTKHGINAGVPLSEKYRQQECLMRRMPKLEDIRQIAVDRSYKCYPTVYDRDAVNITHDQLRNSFMENYEIDARKQRAPIVPRSYDRKLMAAPGPGLVHDKKSLQCKIRAAQALEQARKKNESRDISQKAQHSAVRGEHRQNIPEDEQSHFRRSKDTTDKIYDEQYENSFSYEPEEHRPNIPEDEQSHCRENKDTAEKIYDEQYGNSFSYNQLYECNMPIAGSSKQVGDESDLEVKYKNTDFRGNDNHKDELSNEKDVSYHREPSSVCESSVKNEVTSDEKICSPQRHISCNGKNSARSGHSKNSAMSGSKRYSELVHLERSKCTVLSVIDDGLHRIEQTRNEVVRTPKAGKSTFLKSNKHGSDVHTDESKERSINSTLDIVRSDFMNDMFKECRGYHLEKISQEVQRLKYLNLLPDKWVKVNNSSTSSST